MSRMSSACCRKVLTKELIGQRRLFFGEFREGVRFHRQPNPQDKIATLARLGCLD
jgi:hypothetical protein